MKPDFLVVGAGFYGAVFAERLATELGAHVLVIDRRSHIGGNCYTHTDPTTKIEVHRYGTHIFHTSNRRVWEYLNRFTEFNGYHHQVLTTFKNQVYQMPINLETINSFYKKNFTPEEAKAFIEKEANRDRVDSPKNLEEKAAGLIGRPLYEAFIRGYTMKQWGTDPKNLSPAIISRLPVRFNYCEDYFNNCRWQGIPVDGYTAIFERLFDHKNITVELDCDFFKERHRLRPKMRTIYTGPIDRYFEFHFGKLPWRSIRLEKEIVSMGDFQGTSVMNYAEETIPYTRIHEPRHLHPERPYPKDSTVIFREFSEINPEEPYYPINTPENKKLLGQYLELAKREKDVVFGGRLGDYAYYDMDMTIGAALTKFENLVGKPKKKAA